MAKVTVQQIAKELSVPTGQVIRILRDLGVPENEAKSGLDKQTAETVKSMAQELEEELRTLLLPPQISVRELAQALECAPTAIQKKLMEQNMLVGVTQKLEKEIVESIVEEFGLKARWEEPSKPQEPVAKIKSIGSAIRPPVVTILGHVDHGKTSLLDYIRNSKVVDKEFGGITQHIGAYQVEVEGKLITFIDTPGHAAFTAMRARGAQVTDIAVLVVAADDGMMPQTVEALNHAKSANVPIIVAINKIDKPQANPTRVKTQLVEHELMPEEYGGDVIVVEVSAHTGEGIDKLLEMILLVAEIAELKADPNAPFVGTVIEAKMSVGRGPVATVLAQQGTLRVGDNVVVGAISGRVRAMFDHQGKPIDKAGPSTPVEVNGLREVPVAGDRVEVVSDEGTAKRIAEERKEQAKDQAKSSQTRRVKLEDLKKLIQAGELKDLNIILKADVSGSMEAIRDSLAKMEVPDGVQMRLIHSGVGNINESDITLAIASNGLVLGFNVKIETNAHQIAKAEKIDVRTYNIIYVLLDEVQRALKGLLEPVYEEVHLGTAEVRAVFKLSRGITVAGCYVLEGKIVRNALARLKRGQEVAHDGKVTSIRHIKEDVREIAAGYECGINMGDFTAFKEGDKIECYDEREVER
ncbi:MAG: translation initiation factor IF-2 [Fimbriimonadia bacterium]|nr:translation initiation factor IF-2 [Fimbriimonadia bacterium]